MTLYRALRRLSNVAERGDITALAHLTAAQIDKLFQVGAIAPVSAPPLAELPGWSTRAGKLRKVDIQDADQLVEADVGVVAQALRVKVETAMRYQEEVRAFLVIPPMGEERE